MDEQTKLDTVRYGGDRSAVKRDPISQIRLELDPKIGPAEMRRPSDLLAFGPEIPDQPPLPFLEDRRLRFVVKRHRATTLHTDFRLEAFGCLISWVMWKKPGLDPRKVLTAREMHDHDPRWIESERRIPDGAYGAGPMVVWDRGRYTPLVSGPGSNSLKAVEALRKGCLDFALSGERLQGVFRLERSDKDWRLHKLEDDFATTALIAWPDLSIITGKSLDDVEHEYQAGRALTLGAKHHMLPRPLPGQPS